MIRVRTDAGVEGVGSVYSHPGLTHLLVEDQFRPLLLDRDPLDIEAIWQDLYTVSRWYGRKGVALSALGGIDVALWDILGKVTGDPVWRLLGGKSSLVPAYASALLWASPEELADEACFHVASGFRRMKMRLGRSPTWDLAALSAVRRAVGSSVDILVDLSMRYPLSAARELLPRLAELGVFWFEEPFPPERVDDYAALRGELGVPLAAGENEFGRQGFVELMEAGAVDSVQPDVSRTGGITVAKEVATLAAARGLQVATHTWSDAIAIIANAHVVAATPTGLTIEIDRTGTPFVDRLLGAPPVVVDGAIDLGNRPGLGIDVDWEVVRHHRLADPMRVPAGNYSDMYFGAESLPRTPPFSAAEP